MRIKVFTMLGPVEVHAGDNGVALGGARNQSILAALLLDTGRVVSIRRLIDAAWGDDPPSSARAQVQNRVGVLRRLLRSEHAESELIATRGSGYQLNLDGWQLDLRQFDEAVDRANVMADGGDLAGARATLCAALQLWRGPALDGLSTPLLQTAAAQIEERRLSALERRIQLDLALGRHGELVSELTNLTGEHPYREGLQALLTLALYRSGRRAEALNAHQRVRRLLVEQIGVEPGELLRTLHGAMLRGDESLAWRPPVDETVVRSVAVPHELPADVALFTGQRRALAELDLLLPEAGAPAVSAAIAGSAGVGKTALAVHWAHQVAHRFPDGQLFINLHGYAPEPPLRPTAALGVLLRSLGVRPEEVPVDVAGASAMYRSLTAGKRLLVVLDNARSAEDVRPLLPGGPGCLVLITSRDRLAGLAAREGVRRLTLGVLTPDDAGTLLARLLGEDHARAEPEAIGELASLCAYLPLALRIAVASLAHRPYRRVADLVAELRTEDRLAALAADDDDEAAIQVAFDLSYETVPPAAQRLFRLLGLAPGEDFSTATAAALSGTAPAEAELLLERLAAAHLIEEHAPGRFAFHDLLRRYAHDRAMRQHSAHQRRAALGRLHGSRLAELDYPAGERDGRPARHQRLLVCGASGAACRR
ncbi:AfsR/SARP family transcriptional regulator [Micromonospora profundi]|uniref:AfsR/SARP family transcriptional regulator n=1 Tax=Micromonospora profundi TaxID=1420889 RepID=UPI00168F29F9|nr:AfsR/SARP family transcriptional regulator [Micromonospora profundi]NJC10470.1 DNA-binding SARP family transcriptional activator [Micromonospora profundi]